MSQIELTQCPVELLMKEVERRIYDLRNAKQRLYVLRGQIWGERLKDARQWLGIDQKQAAAILHVTPPFVSMLESGKRPTASKRYALRFVDKAIREQMV